MSERIQPNDLEGVLLLPAFSDWPLTKRCMTCRGHKSPSSYPKHFGAHDGRRLHCRECLAAGRYRPYIENPEGHAAGSIPVAAGIPARYGAIPDRPDELVQPSQRVI